MMISKVCKLTWRLFFTAFFWTAYFAGSGMELSADENDKLTVLCIGDSITAGAYPDKLRAMLEAEGRSARVWNAGMAGYTSGAYLSFMNNFSLFQEIKPDIILLQLGTNDARTAPRTSRFKNNMTRLLESINEKLYVESPPSIFISTVPPVRTDLNIPKEISERINIVNTQIRKLADLHSLQLVDNHTLFKDNLKLLEDGIHPNEKGYGLMAEKWLSAILSKLDDKVLEQKTGFIYDHFYGQHNPGENHPENALRLQAILQRLKEDNLFSALRHIPPSPADLKWIYKVHTRDYVSEMRESCRRGKNYLHSPDTGMSPESYEVALLAAGGVLKAIDAVMDGSVKNAFCAVRPPGHHATANRAMGFCFFNNVAIGARYIQGKHNLSKVLIVDWDVHHGNGTQDIFYDDPDVLFFSVHQHPLYPGTGGEDEKGAGEGYGYNINVQLPAGSGNAEYMKIFREVLIPRALEFKPDFILISAGFDAHQNDPLGGMNLTSEGFAEMTEIVKKIADKTCGGRIVSVLEGGYDLYGLAESVSAHVRSLHKGEKTTEIRALKKKKDINR